MAGKELYKPTELSDSVITDSGRGDLKAPGRNHMPRFRRGSSPEDEIIQEPRRTIKRRSILALFTALGGGGVAYAAVKSNPLGSAALDFLVPSAHAGESNQISDQEIERLMSLGSCDEILAPAYRSGAITRLSYDAANRRHDFAGLEREVFQASSSQKMPVLCMFYENTDQRPEVLGGNMREAIIFRELQKIYGGRIKFIGYQSPIPSGTANTPQSPYNELVNSKYVIKGPPSIAMFSTFDLVKGETPQSNDGKIKQIDTLFGGPATNPQIIRWIRDFQVYWINPNLFNIPNPDGEGVLYRFMNNTNYQKVPGFVHK